MSSSPAILNCFACFNVLCDPRELPCGHVFCLDCIDKRGRSRPMILCKTPSQSQSQTQTQTPSPTQKSSKLSLRALKEAAMKITLRKSADGDANEDEKLQTNGASSAQATLVPDPLKDYVCAQCNVVFAFDHEQLQSLPVSLIHTALIKQYTEDQESFVPSCNAKGCAKPAAFYNQKHSVAVCVDCAELHEQDPATKAIPLTPWKRRYEPPIGTCWAHQKKIEFYCPSCPWKCFQCAQCKWEDENERSTPHKKHMSIESAKQELKKISTFKSKIPSLKQAAAKWLSKIEPLTDKISEHFGDVDEIILSKFEAPRRAIDEWEQKVIEKVNICRQTDLKAMSFSEMEANQLLAMFKVFAKKRTGIESKSPLSPGALASHEMSAKVRRFHSFVSAFATRPKIGVPSVRRIYYKIQPIFNAKEKNPKNFPLVHFGYHPIIREADTIDKPKFQVGRNREKNAAFQHPWQLAVHPVTKNLYVAEAWGNNRIQILNKDFEHVSYITAPASLKRAFGDPTGVAFSFGGEYMVIVENLNHCFHIYDGEGNYTRTVGSRGKEPSQFDRPFFAAFDQNDDIWISDQVNNRVQKFNKDGEFLLQINSTNEVKFSEPMGLIITDSNELHVVGISGSSLQVFSLDGDHLRTYAVQPTSQNYLARGPNGGFVLTNRTGGITFHDSEGKLQKTLNSSDPIGLVFLEDGSMVLSNSNACELSIW